MLRLAAKEGEHTETWAIALAYQMWKLANAAHAGKFTEIEPTLVKGIRFTPGPNEKRRDLLSRLIDDALIKLGRNAKPAQVLAFIRADAAIQDIDPDDSTISWRGGKGVGKTTSFKAFRNRLSERRKLFHK